MRTRFLALLNRPVSSKLAAGIIAAQLLLMGLAVIDMADVMCQDGLGPASVTIQMQMPIRHGSLGRATEI
jgi:hypothetical protein